MKTTLTIDTDVADALKERADVQRKPFEQVVNEALRGAVSGDVVREKAKPVYRVKPFRSGFMPGIDPENPKKFLDDEDIKKYLRLRDGDNSRR